MERNVYSKYTIAALILGIGFLVVGALVYGSLQQQPLEVACTMEAKMCADGSAVGRSGPLCEFALCPGMVTDESGSTGAVIVPPVISPQACTKDAKICPDGSSVGRSGPACSFAPCPPSDPVAESWGTIVGKVELGPVCPVERNPPDPKCAPQPHAATFILLTADQTKTVKTFSSNAEGKFTVDVPAGKYVIQPTSNPSPFPHCSASEILIVPVNDSVEVTLYCDTGIR